MDGNIEQIRARNISSTYSNPTTILASQPLSKEFRKKSVNKEITTSIGDSRKGKALTLVGPLSAINKQEHRESEEISPPSDTCLRSKIRNDLSGIDKLTSTNEKAGEDKSGGGSSEIYALTTQ